MKKRIKYAGWSKEDLSFVGTNFFLKVENLKIKILVAPARYPEITPCIWICIDNKFFPFNILKLKYENIPISKEIQDKLFNWTDKNREFLLEIWSNETYLDSFSICEKLREDRNL